MSCSVQVYESKQYTRANSIREQVNVKKKKTFIIKSAVAAEF